MTINHDGVFEGDYETKEAAFESAAIAASNAIKAGYGVAVTVESRSPDEPAPGITKQPARLGVRAVRRA
jgi:hypothetical protein